MEKRLADVVSKDWFSNYNDPRLAFNLICPGCSKTIAVDAGWKDARKGIGPNNEVRLRSFWPLQLDMHLIVACPSCEGPITIFFGCGAGGRQGEMQCGIVAIEHNRVTKFFER